MSPRRKEFDPAKALDDAMRLFWRQGYESTSVQDLVDGLGINRFSLYDSFGDKRALFLAACERYKELMEEKLKGLEDPEVAGLEAIRRFFRGVVERCGSDQGKAGCLIANTVVEKALSDGELRDLARCHLLRMERAFASALERAKAAGVLPASADCAERARFLTCVLTGLGVVGKMAPERSRAESIVERALKALEGE